MERERVSPGERSRRLLSTEGETEGDQIIQRRGVVLSFNEENLIRLMLARLI